MIYILNLSDLIQTDLFLSIVMKYSEIHVKNNYFDHLQIDVDKQMNII